MTTTGRLSGTQFDPPSARAKYLSLSNDRAAVSGADASCGTTGSVDTMLQGVVVYQQIGQSCCGEAEAQAASALSHLAGHRRQYSGLAAYYYARLEANKFFDQASDPYALQDVGTFPWAVCEAWKLHGIPLEADWPHDKALLQNPPGWGAAVESSLHRTDAVRRVDSVGMDLVRDTEICVRANCPVMITLPVRKAFEEHIGNSAIGVLTGPILGLHRLPVLGLTSTGLFIVVNSWGIGWGDAGFGYLSAEVIAQQALDVNVVLSFPV